MADVLALKNVAGTSTLFTLDDSGNVSFLGTLTPSGAAALQAVTTTSLAAAGRVTTTDGVTSGTARTVGGTAYVQTTPTTVTNSVSTEQTFGTAYAMPANTMKAGSRIRLRGHGEVTASAGADTLTIKVYVGSVVVWTSSAVDTSANSKFSFDYELVSTAAPGASVAVYGVGRAVDPAATTFTLLQTGNGGTTLATNAAADVKVTATWSATTATNTATLDIFVVEIE